MDHLSKELTTALLNLKKTCPASEKSQGTHASGRAKERFDRVVADTTGIVDVLTRAPYTPARHLAGQTGLDRDHIILSYKLIQQTKAATERLRASPNGDYLNIVHHYFTSRMYVVVFFVGLSCPGRCLFCPNVTVKSDGTRKISRYPATKSECMSEKDIDAVFRDISRMQSLGIPVLVKISGGLEPLSDPETMALILDRAQKNGVHVKLFTNGFLLNTTSKRRLALKANDVRISLSVMDDKAFGDIMLGNAPSRIKKYGLSAVLDNIRNLVHLRDEQHPGTKIGINTIVLEENHRKMPDFIRLAGELGADYIDFKPNYFSGYTPSTQARIKEMITRIKAQKKEYPVGVFAAGSLARDNLFWTHRDGVCRPHKQSRFKLFITPHGHCSPVHHGAFPGWAAGRKDAKTAYSGGRITPDNSLLDIIGNMPRLPDLAYDRLNPFEHMLALEIEREEADRNWGIPKACDPYNFPMAETIPQEIKKNPLLRMI